MLFDSKPFSDSALYSSLIKLITTFPFVTIFVHDPSHFLNACNVEFEINILN